MRLGATIYRRLFLVFTTVVCSLASLPARAGLEGRLSSYNLTSLYGASGSTADGLLVRTWLVADELGGKNLAFRLDARSELSLINSRGAFNEACDGKQSAACEDEVQRHARLGDLDRVAGIYDAHLQIGGRPGSLGFQLGRRTMYEAGAVTVDGIGIYRQGESGRIGMFAGIAPNPETGIPDPKYQAAGAYVVSNKRRALLRVSAAAEFFDVKPDLVYLYTQDFFQLGSGLTLSTIAQVDFVPFVADRLVLVDLTYRTGPRWRLRLSMQRYRSLAFENRPLFKETIKDFTADLNSNLVIPTTQSFTKATTYHTVRLIGQYELGGDITGFAKVGFRQRTIDNSTGPVIEVGAATYHPIRYPVQGQIRYRYDGAFSSKDHTVVLSLWRKLSFTSPITFGGTVSYVTSTYTNVNKTLNPNVSKKSSVVTVAGFFRWDIAKYMFQAQYEAARPSGQTEALDQTGLEHLLILGFTVRFGQGAKRLF